MSVDLIAVLIAILAVGAALGGLLLTGLRGLRAEMGALRAEMGALRGDMGALRTELRGDMDSLRTELRGDMDALRTELRGEMKLLRAEVGELRKDVQGLDQRVSRLEGKFDIVERYVFARNEARPVPAE